MQKLGWDKVKIHTILGIIIFINEINLFLVPVKIAISDISAVRMFWCAFYFKKYFLNTL